MDTYTLLYFKWITNCIAHGTLLSVTWQPGWEGSLWENGYMYRHGSVPSLFTLNYHSIVNWLSPIQNKKLKKKKDFKAYPRYSKSTIPGQGAQNLKFFQVSCCKCCQLLFHSVLLLNYINQNYSFISHINSYYIAIMLFIASEFIIEIPINL